VGFQLEQREIVLGRLFLQEYLPVKAKLMMPK
jgi:hypothetical protein